MPWWINFIHNKTSKIYTHESVKLFIRAVLNTNKNTKQVFKAYAKFWSAPVISFLVSSLGLATTRSI